MVDTTDRLAPGARFGRYMIESRLARGGMGEVWLATACGPGGFQKKVVLKTVLPDLMERQDYVEMLVQEASLAARLNHPNIVQVFDLGCVGEIYYIAMEHLCGRTLAQILQRTHERRERIPMRILFHALAACCDGLQYAHDYTDYDGRPLGMLHRDISPSNIMFTFSGHVALLDFGVATSLRDDGHKTEAGCIKGKFHYLAPERARSEAADRRSDIYAVGVVLYQCLTMRWPFRTRNEYQLLSQIATQTPPPPTRYAPWIPPPLERLILRAMARDRADRHPEARILASELREFLRASGPEVEPVELAGYLAELFPEAPEASAVPRPTPSSNDESIEIVFHPAALEAASALPELPLDEHHDVEILAAGSPAPVDALPERAVRGFDAATRSALPADVDIFPEPTRVAPIESDGDVFGTYTRVTGRRRRDTEPAFFGAPAVRRERAWPFATTADDSEADEPADDAAIHSSTQEVEDAQTTEP